MLAVLNAVDWDIDLLTGLEGAAGEQCGGMDTTTATRSFIKGTTTATRSFEFIKDPLRIIKCIIKTPKLHQRLNGLRATSSRTKPKLIVSSQPTWGYTSNIKGLTIFH